MPRGEHENSRRALEENRKDTRFNGETAKAANRKSKEAQRWKKTVREAIHEQTTPEEVAELILKMARKHNLKALDMILEITGDKAAAKVTVTNRYIDDSARELQEYLERALEDG